MPIAFSTSDVVKGDRHLPANLTAATTFTFQTPPLPGGLDPGSTCIYVHAIVGGYTVNVPQFATTPGRLVGVMLTFASVSDTGNGSTQVLCCDGGGVGGLITNPVVAGASINLNFGFPGLKLQRTTTNVYTIVVDVVGAPGTGAQTGAWEINPTGPVKLAVGQNWGNVSSGLAFSYSFGRA